MAGGSSFPRMRESSAASAAFAALVSRLRGNDEVVRSGHTQRKTPCDANRRGFLIVSVWRLHAVAHAQAEELRPDGEGPRRSRADCDRAERVARQFAALVERILEEHVQRPIVLLDPGAEIEAHEARGRAVERRRTRGKLRTRQQAVVFGVQVLRCAGLIERRALEVGPVVADIRVVTDCAGALELGLTGQARAIGCRDCWRTEVCPALGFGEDLTIRIDKGARCASGKLGDRGSSAVRPEVAEVARQLAIVERTTGRDRDLAQTEVGVILDALDLGLACVAGVARALGACDGPRYTGYCSTFPDRWPH